MGKKKSDDTGCIEYDVLVRGIEMAKAQVKVAGKKAVAALLRQFFGTNPSVRAVGWTQYTPYFNDGEACEFGVHDFYACTKDGVDFAKVASLHDDDEAFQDSYDLRSVDKATAAALESLGRIVSEEIFEAAFGDHVMVIATPDGFHVSEYDHE